MTRHDAEDDVCSDACQIAVDKLGLSRWRQQHGRQKVLHYLRRRRRAAKQIHLNRAMHGLAHAEGGAL